MSDLQKIEALSQRIWKCDKCRKCDGLDIKRDPNSGFVPLCFEGNPQAPIWFIGLNPRHPLFQKGVSEDFITYYEKRSKYDFTYSYYTDLQPIIDRINLKLHIVLSFGKDILSNDLVKCSSHKWGFTNTGTKLSKKDLRKMIDNCSALLWEQIEVHNPKYLVCNGVEVSRIVFEHYKKQGDPEFGGNMELSQIIFLKDKKIGIFYSGYLNRTDNLTKMRLADNIVEKMLINEKT